MQKRRRLLVPGLIAAMLAVLLPLALSQRLQVDTYTIASPKVQNPVTLAVATDPVSYTHLTLPTSASV